jgi:hypothetical protein
MAPEDTLAKGQCLPPGLSRQFYWNARQAIRNAWRGGTHTGSSRSASDSERCDRSRPTSGGGGSGRGGRSCGQPPIPARFRKALPTATQNLPALLTPYGRSRFTPANRHEGRAMHTVEHLVLGGLSALIVLGLLSREYADTAWQANLTHASALQSRGVARSAS